MTLGEFRWCGRYDINGYIKQSAAIKTCYLEILR